MSRIYRLSIAGKTRLVRAPNQAQAIAHVSRDSITCSVASQDELVADVSAGLKVEEPKAQAQQEIEA